MKYLNFGTRKSCIGLHLTLLLALQAQSFSFRPQLVAQAQILGPSEGTGVISAQTGQSDVHTVKNGDVVTINLVVSGETQPITVTINLPDASQDVGINTIVCIPECEPKISTATFNLPTGGSYSSDYVSAVVWDNAGRESRSFSVAMPVVDQPTDVPLNFQANVSRADSTEIDLINVVNNSYIINVLPALGGASEKDLGHVVSVRNPIWKPESAGSVYSQDWGDFNHDGWLDLALGGYNGVSVYSNTQGKLERLWASENTLTQTTGVRWADLGNGKLSLVATGYQGGKYGVAIFQAGDNFPTPSFSATTSIAPTDSLPLGRLAVGHFSSTVTSTIVAGAQFFTDTNSLYAWFDGIETTVPSTTIGTPVVSAYKTP